MPVGLDRCSNWSFLPSRLVVVLQACEIMKKRGHGKEEAQQLISQLQAYKAGMAPYDLPGAWEQFNLQVLPFPCHCSDSAETRASVAISANRDTTRISALRLRLWSKPRVWGAVHL